MGATFATQLASESLFIQGLIIGDYIPRYYQLTQKWVGQIKGIEDVSMSAETIEAIARDSEDISFEKKLKELQCPMLLLKGEQSRLQLDKFPPNRICKSKQFRMRGMISLNPMRISFGNWLWIL